MTLSLCLSPISFLNHRKSVLKQNISYCLYSNSTAGSVYQGALNTNIFRDFNAVEDPVSLDLSIWSNRSVNLLQQLLAILQDFRMSSLFPCKARYRQQSLLDNVLAVSCEKSVQFQVWGQKP